MVALTDDQPINNPQKVHNDRFSMRPQNRTGKRQQGRQEEEAEIDDLMVAASFAQVSTFPTAIERLKAQPREDDTSTSDSDSSLEENKLEAIDNEASGESDDDSDSDSDDESGEEKKSIGNEAARQDDGDSDDESDVDLTEALERMQGGKDDPVKSNKGDSQAPTTEHELDPYHTPIEELETKFQLNLTVAEQERLRLETETGMPSSGPIQLCTAGHIKCQMVMDRTIVVESVVSNGSAPLDEGSLLVIRVPSEGDEKANARLLPLGKVFEVFGPVSRPLYTVRLPPVTKGEAKKEIKTNDSVERDADEISLNDDDDTERGESREAETTKGAISAEGEQYIATAVATSSNSDKEKKLDRNDEDNSAHDNESDPWSPDGSYTKLLQSTQNMTVYYIPDITRQLDTGAIIRNSGRGCGKLMDAGLSITLINNRALTPFAVTFHRCIKSV